MIYVDDMRMMAQVGSLVARWSHMFSDHSMVELDVFAAQIGLRKEWRQDSDGFIHYDLTDTRRNAAIRLGAKPISYRELPDYIHRLSPPGQRIRVTTFLTEGLSCPNPAIVE